MRRTPLKRVSDKRAKQLRAYSKARKVFLAAHPYCEAWGIIWPSLKAYTPVSTQVHHTNKRNGSRLLFEGDWLAVCEQSHRWIHANGSSARALGLLV